MQDTPKLSGIQDRCFTPVAALRGDVHNILRLIEALDTDCPSQQGAHELGYSLGWVAQRYAGFSPPSEDSIARHLLFTVDRDIRYGNFVPNYDGETLRCDNSIEPINLFHVGQILRDAKVRSPNHHISLTSE